MANLFWKKDGQTKSLLATPFKTEEEFEKEIFNTQEILEDIFLIKRQIRGGNKTGVPDIVGIDNDGNICIIEMKNVTVDASITSTSSSIRILGRDQSRLYKVIVA